MTARLHKNDQACSWRQSSHGSDPRDVKGASLLWLLLLLWLTIGSRPATAAGITLAVAADLRPAMEPLLQRYQAKRGVKLKAVYGSSGKFFSQITNGAPFDAFFSANSSYPRTLEEHGLAVPGSRFRYGIGRIVLWTGADSGLDVQRGMEILNDQRVQKIAIANPEHAPYGKAAVEAMQKAKVYVSAKERLVYGENIAQAAQFASSGNAQVGFLALSLTRSPALTTGRYWLVPSSLHGELAQEAIILKTAPHQKEMADFFAFIRAPEGAAILKQFGFITPGSR